MQMSLKWSIYGSSLVSSYRNGVASYYRGIFKELAKRGHQITFFEPDLHNRQKTRDIPDPDWAEVFAYYPDREGINNALELGSDADILVKASSIGIYDEQMETAILQLKKPSQLTLFWDVATSSTIHRLKNNPEDPFIKIIPQYDLILTYGGGDPVVNQYKLWGARDCVPIYNALDRSTHFRVPSEARFEGTLGFLGNRLPEREKRVEDFFLKTVEKLPSDYFLLGGNGWSDRSLPENVRYLGQISTQEQNAFNSTVKAVLNLSRNGTAPRGYSPTARVFEAAGAGACVITDAWEGIELFLEPDREVLVAQDGAEVAETLKYLSSDRARDIGNSAYRRICAHHTYEHRAAQIENLLKGRV
jgi:spore maturation protein CgeB